VFDMFARIERSVPHANGGLGIGLALSRQLAEMHGGSLTVTSRGEGHGATFTLSVPGAEPHAPVAAPCQRDKAPGSNAVALDLGLDIGLDIVLIEDNVDAADTLALWLESIGHVAHIARTGSEGLELILEARPQVVLCDIGLPDIDGIEVCRRLMALEIVPRPMMVALTGWGMEDDRKRSAEAGFDLHLVKPVAPEKLRDILSAVKRH
jgi:CheY-like chemotaxis protein